MGFDGAADLGQEPWECAYGARELSEGPVIANWATGLPLVQCHPPDAGTRFGKSIGNNGKVRLEVLFPLIIKQVKS